MDESDETRADDSKSHRPRTVAEIKANRTKKGVLQYRVVFADSKSDSGHWIPAADLDCPDLIAKYEATRGSADSDIQITGLVKDYPVPAYVVRMGSSSKPQIVTRSYLHKHAIVALLNWYESHLSFLPKAEAPAKLGKKKKKGEEEEVPAVEPTPVNVEG
jgi:hypothetical protein